MATEVKRIYLDTNVLAYITNTKAPEHRVVLEIRKFVVCRKSNDSNLYYQRYKSQ